MEEEEIWMPIPGYEGFYAASSFGRIKTVDRQNKNLFIKESIVNTDNECIFLFKGKSIVKFSVGELILMSFRSQFRDTSKGYYVRYIDGIRSNNRLSNLVMNQLFKNNK